MHRLLRVFKTLFTTKQANSDNKTKLISQLYKKYGGRKSLIELKEYVDTLNSEEVKQQLTKTEYIA